MVNLLGEFFMMCRACEQCKEYVPIKIGFGVHVSEQLFQREHKDHPVKYVSIESIVGYTDVTTKKMVYFGDKNADKK